MCDTCRLKRPLENIVFCSPCHSPHSRKHVLKQFATTLWKDISGNLGLGLAGTFPVLPAPSTLILPCVVRMASAVLPCILAPSVWPSHPILTSIATRLTPSKPFAAHKGLATLAIWMSGQPICEQPRMTVRADNIAPTRHGRVLYASFLVLGITALLQLHVAIVMCSCALDLVLQLPVAIVMCSCALDLVAQLHVAIIMCSCALDLLLQLPVAIVMCSCALDLVAQLHVAVVTCSCALDLVAQLRVAIVMCSCALDLVAQLHVALSCESCAHVPLI